MRARLHFSVLIIALVVFSGCGHPADEPVQPAPESPHTTAAAPNAAPASIPSLAGYNVVVVVVDGLRADRAGDAKAAPFISDLATKALSFSDAAANSSHITESLSSFFTGRLPTRGGAIGVYEAEPQDAATTLAQYFQQAGYYTGLLANHPAIQGSGFTKGFEEVQVAQAGQPLDDAALLRRTGEFLEDAGSDRVFLYVHLAGPLASKLYHAEAPTEGAASVFGVREFGEKCAKSGADAADAARKQRTIAEYDAAIHRADEVAHGLADSLQAAGRAEKTLLVITSLHGFELFEHGYLGAGWTLEDESVHVPLIFYAPGAIPASISAAQVSLVDVAPSLLALLNTTYDPAPLDGQTLFAREGDGFRVAPVDRPRIAELVIPERCILRTVTQGEWKYLAASLWAEPKDRVALADAHRDTANAYLDGSRQSPPLWGAGAREVLYKGGAELPLADNEQARAPMAIMLDEYRERCEQSGIAPRIAAQTVKALDPEKVKNLESLGYL